MRTQRAVASLFPAGAAALLPWLSVQVAETTDPEPAGGSALTFSPGTPAQVVVHRLALGFLHRQTGTPPPGPGRREPAGFDFLAAALTAQALVPVADSGQAVPDDAPVRVLVNRGRLPGLADLIERPVPPLWPYEYELYALHANFAAHLLRATPAADARNALEAFLDAAARNQPIAEALPAALAPGLAQGLTVQDWFERAARSRILRARRVDRADLVKARFEEILTVRTHGDGVEDLAASGRVTVEEALADGDLRPTADTLAAMERELFDLALDSPPLLQVPVSTAADTLRRLRTGGDRRAAVRRLKEARLEVEQATARLERIARLLDAAGSVPQGGFDHLAAYLQVRNASRERQGRLQPDLEAFLDTLDAR